MNKSYFKIYVNTYDHGIEMIGMSSQLRDAEERIRNLPNQMNCGTYLIIEHLNDTNCDIVADRGTIEGSKGIEHSKTYSKSKRKMKREHKDDEEN